MAQPSPIRLGINVDHVATLRQARGTPYPDPVEAALLAAAAGADSITVHLREDRRHIQDHDVERLVPRCPVPVNLELAVTAEMVEFAARSALPRAGSMSPASSARSPPPAPGWRRRASRCPCSSTRKCGS